MPINFLAWGKTRWSKQVPNPHLSVPSPTPFLASHWLGIVAERQNELQNIIWYFEICMFNSSALVCEGVTYSFQFWLDFDHIGNFPFHIPPWEAILVFILWFRTQCFWRVQLVGHYCRTSMQRLSHHCFSRQPKLWQANRSSSRWTGAPTMFTVRFLRFCSFLFSSNMWFSEWIFPTAQLIHARYTIIVNPLQSIPYSPSVDMHESRICMNLKAATIYQ